MTLTLLALFHHTFPLHALRFDQTCQICKSPLLNKTGIQIQRYQEIFSTLRYYDAQNFQIYQKDQEQKLKVFVYVRLGSLYWEHYQVFFSFHPNRPRNRLTLQEYR